MTRHIFFQQLKVDAPLGILPHELAKTQPIYIDADFFVSVQQTVDDTDIRTVLDYRLLRQAMISEVTRCHTHLVEVLIDRVCDRLFQDFSQIQEIHLRISKPYAFSDCDAVGIALNMTKTQWKERYV